MIDIDILKKLVPINGLSEHNLERLAKRLVVEEYPQDTVICQEGDTDNDSIFLITGSIEMHSHSSTMKYVIQAGSQEAAFPVAPSRPRQFTITTISKAGIVRIDSSKLDRAVVLDEITTTIRAMQDKKVGQAKGDENWIEQMLSSSVFSKVPNSKITSLIMKLEPISVNRGDVIIKQNDKGDFYYIIKEGLVNISSKDDQGKVRILAELQAGDIFGEEALITGQTRNASVVAMSEGIIMRLPKTDFVELLKKPLLQYISLEQAKQLASDGAGIVDVRSPEDFQQGAIKGSINIPIEELRNKLDKLDTGRQYIICCKTGVQSEVAAFLLSQRGYGVAVLMGGLQTVLKQD